MAIPAGFPKDIYVYDGAKVLTSMTMPQGHMLTLETADPASRVADAYQSAMAAAGWKQEMAMDSGTGKMFSYANAEGRAAADGDHRRGQRQREDDDHCHGDQRGLSGERVAHTPPDDRGQIPVFSKIVQERDPAASGQLAA